MFIGRYYHTLETHHRLSLPKKFRSEEQNWVITRGLDGGLFLFRASDFVTRIQELEQRTLTKKSHRDFVRWMSNDANEVTTDANGRVHLPEYLIEFAGLEKEVVVIGSFNWIEIWDRQRYHTYLDQLTPQAEQIAESIATPDHDQTA